jgi:GAF domain-containing protein
MDVTVSDAKAVLPRPRSDISEESRARRHLDLLSVAASIGASLDVLTTARQLAEVLVPGLGDIAVVNLATEIAEGEEPPQRTGGGDLSLRRAALAPADGIWADGYILVGQDLPPFAQPEVIQTYQNGQAFSLAGRSSITAVVDDDPMMVRALVPADGELVVACAPLVTERGPDAPGLLLGSVEVWRRGLDAPFTADEMQVLQGIATRAAVSIDNARRYTREHALVLAQQRSLLPAVRFTGVAAQVAGRYMPTVVAARARGGGGGPRRRRRLVRRDPPVLRPGRAGRRRRGRPRPGGHCHDGTVAHRRANPRRHRPDAGRAAHLP